MARYEETSPSSTPGDGTREYILEMIAQLAAMARKTNEPEIAIHLTAIRDAARLTKRRPPH